MSLLFPGRVHSPVATPSSTTEQVSGQLPKTCSTGARDGTQEGGSGTSKILHCWSMMVNTNSRKEEASSPAALLQSSTSPSNSLTCKIPNAWPTKLPEKVRNHFDDTRTVARQWPWSQQSKLPLENRTSTESLSGNRGR